MMRLFLAFSFLALCVMPMEAADKDKPKDTKKAARTRKILEKKISIDLEDERLDDVLLEIKDLAPGFTYKLDTRGGVSRNSKLSVVAKNKTVAEVLALMFEKNGLGYYVISNAGNAYDGVVWIKQGKERGYPIKKE